MNYMGSLKLFTQAKLVLYYELFSTQVPNIVATQFFLRQNVFNLINNQLLNTANAKDINTDCYITNSTLASSYHKSVA